MSVRILHTADVHLGASFRGLGPRGAAQRAQLSETFASVVDLALREEVRLFLVAGDLFDSNSVPGPVVGHVAALLDRLVRAGVAVCIAPGTHDPYERGSPYACGPLSGMEGVTVFTREELEPAEFPALGVTVFGCANAPPYRNRYPLGGIRRAGKHGHAVGLLHAGFEVPGIIDDTYLVNTAQVAAAPLDYLALGHYHSFSDRSAGGVSACYCGSPEMVRLQEGGPGCVLAVDLGDRVGVTRHVVGRRSFREVNLRAESLDSDARLKSALEPLADPDLALRLAVEGVRGLEYPDVEAAAEALGGLFFHLSVSDRSIASAGSVDPARYAPGSPAAVYLRLLSDRLAHASGDEREELLEAMRIGAAMLSGGPGR